MRYKIKWPGFKTVGDVMVINIILRSCPGFFFLLCGGLAQAEIVIDNTFSGHETPVLPSKGTMTIDQGFGRISKNGNNLFHSFKVFNVNPGQTAIFTGSNAIKNVISRVTGNDKSNINGRLESKVGSAAFYFINSNGVVFGKEAKVDVPGAFHVSTADVIKFKGGVFGTDNKNVSKLIADPESFGFLSNGKNKNGKIKFNDTNIKFSKQKVYIVSGDIIITNNSVFINKGGEIYLSAVGDIKFDERILDNKLLNLNEVEYRGEININNESTIDASDDGGGLINIRSGALFVNGSDISAINNGGIHANNKGIYVKVANTVSIVNGSQILTSPGSSGSGGDIEIYSNKLNISGYKMDAIGSIKVSGIFTGSGNDNATPGWANGGNIKINSKIITIVDSGVISGSSYGKTEKAGRIDIESDSITIENNNSDNEKSTGILSNACNSSESCKNGDTNAGTININANKLDMRNNATISTSTLNIGGNSGAIIINNKPGYNSHGIIKLTNSKIGTSAKNSNGGNITLGGKILILNGGIIQANADSGNSGGRIKINTDKLLVSHGQLQEPNIVDKRNNFPTGFNVIQAISATGATGTVSGTRPELNINGVMLKLKSNLLPIPDLNATPCKSGQGSSLIQAGYGGMPRKPSDSIYIPSKPAIDIKIGMDVYPSIKNNIDTLGCSPE